MLVTGLLYTNLVYEIVRPVTGTDTRFSLYRACYRTVISVWACNEAEGKSSESSPRVVLVL